MNDYNDLTPRQRGRTLLIVEGNHEKNELFWLIFKCFPQMQIDFADVLIYGTNIYMLYDDIVKEYDEDWDSVDVDLPYLVSQKKTPDNILRKNDFINIFLVFDYERHDPNFSEDKICRLQEYFSDSADVGQLYLNYPMIESYQDMPGYPDSLSDFMNHKVSVTVRPGKVYKNTVKDSVIAKKTGLPQKIREILMDRFEMSSEEDAEQCMQQLLTLNSNDSFVSDAEALLKHYLSEEKAITAANQFFHMISRIGYISENINFWRYMQNEFRKIIRTHICKADRIVTGNDSIENYQDRFRNIDYDEILNVQNTVSTDDATGFIWVLNSSILLVPDYNLAFIEDDNT